MWCLVFVTEQCGVRRVAKSGEGLFASCWYCEPVVVVATIDVVIVVGVVVLAVPAFPACASLCCSCHVAALHVDIGAVVSSRP